MSHASLSVVISIAIIQSIDHSLYCVGTRTPGHTYSCACLIVSIGKVSTSASAGLGCIITEIVVGSSIAEIGAAVVVIISPSIIGAIGPVIPTGRGAVHGVMEANTSEIISPSAIRTLQ